MDDNVDRKRIGDAGENAAVNGYINDGYKIVERNYRSRTGEVDIIARKDDILVFSEVRTRKKGAIVSAAESVTMKKQQKIISAAEKYLVDNSCDLFVRFDVVLVTHVDGRIVEADRIENAFEVR